MKGWFSGTAVKFYQTLHLELCNGAQIDQWRANACRWMGWWGGAVAMLNLLFNHCFPEIASLPGLLASAQLTRCHKGRRRKTEVRSSPCTYLPRDMHFSLGWVCLLKNCFLVQACCVPPHRTPLLCFVLSDTFWQWLCHMWDATGPRDMAFWFLFLRLLCKCWAAAWKVSASTSSRPGAPLCHSACASCALSICLRLPPDNAAQGAHILQGSASCWPPGCLQGCDKREYFPGKDETKGRWWAHRNPSCDWAITSGAEQKQTPYMCPRSGDVPVNRNSFPQENQGIWAKYMLLHILPINHAVRSGEKNDSLIPDLEPKTRSMGLVYHPCCKLVLSLLWASSEKELIRGLRGLQTPRAVWHPWMCLWKSPEGK